MSEFELNKWWAKLPVKHKEELASKIALKYYERDEKCYYPDCTKFWILLDTDIKQTVHDSYVKQSKDYK